MMDFLQDVLVILYIPTLICGNSEITTVIQDIKMFSATAGSRESAENLCQENGYRLFTMKNKSKRDALKQYVSKNGINTSTGFWLGMTDLPSGSLNWFWSDGTQVQSESLLWKTGYPNVNVGQCVQINTFDGTFFSPPSYGWQSKACSDTDPRIVCEKDISSPCYYSNHDIPNICPKSSFSEMKERVLKTVPSLADCQKECSNFLNNDYECWSLTFEPSSSMCVLYCYYSPFLLSEILPEDGIWGVGGFAQACSNTNFQHKTCFSATVDTRTLTATTSILTTSETVTTTAQSITNFPTSANIPTSSSKVTTTADPTTKFPTSANIPTGSAKVTTTAESTTKFPTSATEEVSTMILSPTADIHTTCSPTTDEVSTTTFSPTTNELTLDSSATEIVSLSPTNKPTTSGVAKTRPKPLYLYPCPVSRCSGNNSNETLEQSIQRLTHELTLNPNDTSAARRQKTSAEDSRSSAAAVGIVGIMILSLIGFLVVIPDVISFLIHLRRCLYRKERDVLLKGRE